MRNWMRGGFVGVSSWWGGGVFRLCLVVARLVFLQVVRHEDLAEQAESNRTAIVPVVPNRGLILDRNGVVLATNYAAYTLEITPSRWANWTKPLMRWRRWWTFSSATGGAFGV